MIAIYRREKFSTLLDDYEERGRRIRRLKAIVLIMGAAIVYLCLALTAERHKSLHLANNGFLPVDVNLGPIPVFTFDDQGHIIGMAKR